jgi:cobalt-precorrin 5A hydrolase
MTFGATDDQRVAVAVGIGCRREVSAAQVQAAIAHVLARADLSLANVHGLFTADFKAEQTALRQAASALDKPLTFLPLAELKAHAAAVHTHSEHVFARWGVPSVAETAALAGAQSSGSRPACLMGPRVVHEGVTCALAVRSRVLSKTARSGLSKVLPMFPYARCFWQE